MALARYFMFSQVYYHPVRLVYDIHLQDFLGAWLAEGRLFGGTFPTDVNGHLRMTDNEVNAAMRLAALDKARPGHDPARRILGHQHYKILYERNPQDIKVNSDPGAAIKEAAVAEFGAEAVRYSKPKAKGVGLDFPVRTRDGRIQPAISVSEALSTLRPSAIDYVYVDPEFESRAADWLKRARDQILSRMGREEDQGE